MSIKRENSDLKNKLISVVIPAFKAEKFIARNLNDIKRVLDETRYKYEIICVVDGRVDKTFEEAEKVAKKFPTKIKVDGYLTNLGKGHAVRYGMAKAKGDIIGFIDAGTEINPNGISMLLEHMEWYDADIIVGSKRHPASKVDYPWKRRVLSFGFQMLVRILLGFKIKDTQVGIKFFRREVLKEVLPRLLIKRYAFDVEILAVANYLGYKRIFEAPIELKYNFKDLVHASTLKAIFNMLWDTLAVFYRLKIVHYYDSKNRRNWLTPEYLTFQGAKGV